jgi:mannose-6-phosphate isomerase-like protein (cupin superfamily)
MISFLPYERFSNTNNSEKEEKDIERDGIMGSKGIVKVGVGEGRRLPVKHPAAAEITMLIDGETSGSKYLSENITRIKPGGVLEPAHSHEGIEEIVYVLAGEGEMWMEGTTFSISKGDSIFFPAGSIHTVRNTGSITLELLCIFSSSQYRKEGAYRTHDCDVF